MSYSHCKTITPDNTKLYIKEINELKREYKGKIEVFCGLELDMYSGAELSPFDYTLGAVHYLKMGNDYIGFDRSAEAVDAVIHDHFGGDFGWIIAISDGVC